MTTVENKPQFDIMRGMKKKPHKMKIQERDDKVVKMYLSMSADYPTATATDIFRAICAYGVCSADTARRILIRRGLYIIKNRVNHADRDATAC